MSAWRATPVLLAVWLGCGGGPRTAAGSEDTTAQARSIDDVLAAHTPALLALPGVVGTAVALCEGERCIKVLIADSSAAARARVPPRLEGFRVVVEVSGPLRPLEP